MRFAVASRTGRLVSVAHSADSDPALSAPRPSGEGRVEVLREMDLGDLAVEPVWTAVEGLRSL